MAAPLLLSSGTVRCEAALSSCGASSCLFSVIATVFQLYPGGDIMCEMRRRMPEPTLLPTMGIFNRQHQMGMVREELAFDDAVSYTQW